ncbi:MAG: XisI protein [Spirulina sp. SIO3F2]|nr:XisI protein [Spirulina sp. SIO3F2]
MADLRKVEMYRAIIRQLLGQYATYKPSHGEIEVHPIFDDEHNHYQVVGIGWDQQKRVYGCSIHLEIKNEKIWIQLNNTEWDIAQALVEENISKDDIVIGFHPPSLRQYSGYAVA